jgi:lysyl-tRNA synthetase class 2
MNIDALKSRFSLIKRLRCFFDEEGFVEVDSPARILAPAPELHIDCPPVSTGGFLRASPELQMKRLLANGMEKIYQIGPCFRDGEKGRRHNPEFTMLEWYRLNASYLDIADDLENLLECISLGKKPFERIRVREAYKKIAGWDPWKDWDSDRFDFDMAVKIEPAIAAMGGGVFLFDYPVQAASLSKVSGEGEDAFAERWEFYWNGIELANAFTELCDEEEQRRRFADVAKERHSVGEADYPIDEAFLNDLSNIPSAAGVAVGVDRLVMSVLGVDDINIVRISS